MIIARFLKAEKGERWTVYNSYDNGGKEEIHSGQLAQLTDDGVKGLMRSEIARIETLQDTAKFTLIEGQIVDLATPPPPTEEEKATLYFMEARSAYLRKQRGTVDGFPIDGLEEARKAMLALYKPEYEGLL